MNSYRANSAEVIKNIHFSSSIIQQLTPQHIQFRIVMDNTKVSIGVGEKGVGKNSTALISALSRLKYGLCNKIIITSAVHDKTLEDFYEPIEKLLGRECATMLTTVGLIEFVPYQDICFLPETVALHIIFDDIEYSTLDDILEMVNLLNDKDRLVLLGNLVDDLSVPKSNGLVSLIHSIHNSDIPILDKKAQLFIF